MGVKLLLAFTIKGAWEQKSWVFDLR